MARKPRLEYEGALYHVMSRGNRGEVVFQENDDRILWLDTLSQACERTGWRVHAYVLLDNHYHLLLETPEANLVLGMKWFQGTFTQRINLRRQCQGHLFQGRYKALVIDPDEKRYFSTVGNYIHLNPVRAGRIERRPGALKQYRWSSYPSYLSRPMARPSWLVVSKLLWTHGLEDRARDRKAYENQIEALILEWHSKRGKKILDHEWRTIRKGWFLGGDAFREFLLDLVEEVLEGKREDSFSGEAAKMHDERGAKILCARALRILGLERRDLTTMKKGCPEKAAIAWWIRTQTTISNRWISEQLDVGHPGNVSALVRRTKEAKSGTVWKLRRKLEKMLKS